MATWNEVKNVLHQKFNAVAKNDSLLQIRLLLPNNRLQDVFIHLQKTLSTTKYDDNWIQFYSPIGVIPEKLLNPVLELLSEKNIFGELVLDNGIHCIRHSVSLADISTEHYLFEMQLIGMLADNIEKEFLGVDKR
ncbi:MAG: hypothetical protein FWG98_03390 [Candidatus Cloacimonetes bacterium]|nr:hypothetical protein [Candidatus Cloacimonadota bacterium]